MFAVDTYQRRRRDKADWSAPTEDLDAFVKESCDLLGTLGDPFNISVAHGNYGPNRHLPYIRAHLGNLLENQNPGTPIVVAAQKGEDIVAFAFRRVHSVIEPASTEGSPDIDLIHAAVVAEFGKRGWGLHSVGLYVRKPGEHGATGYANGHRWYGNAEDWEFSDSPSDTPTSDAKLDGLAKWLLAQQENGLPVGGIISQGMAWWIFYNGWETYKPGYDRFTRHYSHVHVSGATHDRLSGWFLSHEKTVIMDDPLGRLRLVLGYVVGFVWAVSFIAILVAPHTDDTALLYVQGAMMLVLGGLYAARIRRNGRNGR